VISPTARGYDGKIYNCNADVAAAHGGHRSEGRRLVFMSDVPGLMRDPKDPDSTLIPHLRIERSRPGSRRPGVVDKGMIPKVDSAVAAIIGRRRRSFRRRTDAHSRPAGNLHR
jgi:acetylglutamate kinase